MAVVSERPISSILGEMADHVERIVRAEFTLATMKMRDELRRFERASLLLAVGLAVAALAAVFVLLAIVFALATVMPPPAAALLVGVAAAAVSIACISAGWKRLSITAASTRLKIEESLPWTKMPSR